ncbi:DUF6206 family protein [Streptomyces sp. 372A]
MNRPPAIDLPAEAHLRIEDAVVAGDTGDLHVVGFGEITLAVSWPSPQPTIVVKRLPPFRTRADFDAYRSTLEDWTAEMERRGVAVVQTSLHAVDNSRWGTVGYLLQPLLPKQDLAVERCRSGSTEEAEQVIAAVVAAIGRGVDGQAALDGQLPNWCVRADGSLAIMDVSTPFLRDAAGADRLSTALVARGYPAVLRPVLSRQVLPSVIDAYHSPRSAVRDFACNLLRLDLGRYLSFALQQADQLLGIELGEAEVRETFAKDARMWGVLQSLRRADRWWQRAVRRRPYPALLPPKYDPRTDYNGELA